MSIHIRDMIKQWGETRVGVVGFPIVSCLVRAGYAIIPSSSRYNLWDIVERTNNFSMNRRAYNSIPHTANLQFDGRHVSLQ